MVFLVEEEKRGMVKRKRGCAIELVSHQLRK